MQSDERIECVGCGKPDRVVKGDGPNGEAAIYPEGWGLVYFEGRPLPVCSGECRSKAHAEKWRLRLAVNRVVEKEKRVRVEAFSDLVRASAAKAFCSCPVCISNRRYGTDVPCAREAEVKAREREAAEVTANAPRCGTCVYFALHGDGTGTCGHHATAKPITPEDICGAFMRRSAIDAPERRCALDTLLANDPTSRTDSPAAIEARRSTRRTCRCDDCAMWRLSQDRPTNPATANPFVRDGDATVMTLGKEKPVPDNSAFNAVVQTTNEAIAKREKAEDEKLIETLTSAEAKSILPIALPIASREPEDVMDGLKRAAALVRAMPKLPWKPTAGATVYHKLTGEGPWIAVKAEELETLRSAPDPRGKNGELLKPTTIATWTVSTESGKFLAVPEALLAPNPPTRARSRKVLVAVLAFVAACAVRLAWAWLTAK